MHELKMNVQAFFMEALGFLSPEFIVLLVSALPVLEVKGGMPAGSFLGLSFHSAFFYSALGNLLPVLPVLLLFKPISQWMMRLRFYKHFYGWLSDRAVQKGSAVEKYGALGLVLFTAVPLPTTGAYSACLLHCCLLCRLNAHLCLSALACWRRR